MSVISQINRFNMTPTKIIGVLTGVLILLLVAYSVFLSVSNMRLQKELSKEYSADVSRLNDLRDKLDMEVTAKYDSVAKIDAELRSISSEILRLKKVYSGIQQKIKENEEYTNSIRNNSAAIVGELNRIESDIHNSKR